MPIFWVSIHIHNIRFSRGIAGFRVLTSSLIRSRSRKLELRRPKGVGSNCKHRLMTPPEESFPQQELSKHQPPHLSTVHLAFRQRDGKLWL